MHRICAKLWKLHLLQPAALVRLVAQRALPARGAAALEKMARSLVMRFAPVPGIVAELHGDGDNPAAFAPLLVSGRDAPRISL